MIFKVREKIFAIYRKKGLPFNDDEANFNSKIPCFNG